MRNQDTLSQRLTERLPVRSTPEQKARIEEAAWRSRVSVSDFVREAADAAAARVLRTKKA